MKFIFYLTCALLINVSVGAYSQNARSNSSGEERIVTGVVTDVTGELLPSVNVIIKGTTTGVISDTNGKYSINVSDKDATLVFSFIGFTQQEIKLDGRQKIDVVLKENSLALQEVIVLGYGAATRKADLSASIGIVTNMEMVKNRPVTNVTSLLQGQIPGVTVSNNGGSPAEDPTIVIRGNGSRGGEKPLWVVDGVPGAPIPLNEIESIVVLKDAASAAIYGAYSGSAGVILVTTKKAKTGRPSVTYEGTYGIAQATNLMQSLTIEEQREVRKASFAADGQNLPTGWDPTKNPYIGQTRTDWMDAIFRTAPFQRHYLAFEGGTDLMSNKLSVQYSDNQGTIINSWKKELYLRYQGSYQLGKYIRVREDATWNTAQSRHHGTEASYSSAIFSAMVMPRHAEVYYDGTYGPAGTWGGTVPSDPAYAAQYGVFADIFETNSSNAVHRLVNDNNFSGPSYVTSSSFLEILNPIPGLKFTSRFTYKLDYDFSKGYSPRMMEPGSPKTTNGLSYSASRFYKWEFENTLNYDHTFGRHTVGALLSTTANEQRGRSFSARGDGFESDAEAMQYLNYATQNIVVGDGYMDPDNNVSGVGRIAYSYDDRYFVTASYRRDYAGRLPVEKKYGDFPSVTAAWKLSEEAFFPKTDFINYLKFRGSWGRIGNLASIGYAYGNPTLNLISENTGFLGNGSVVSTVTIGSAFNPYLTWETSEQTDLGLDASFLKDRLSLSVDYFNKRTYNLIKQQDLNFPDYIGVGTKLINEGEIRNTGVEFLVGWNDTAGKNWSYFLNANLGTLKNWVSDIGLADPATGVKPVWRLDDVFRSGFTMPFRTIEGEPLNSYWLIQSAGLFQSDAEAAAYQDKDGNRIQPNAKAGDLKFIDQNGDGTINNDDKLQMGAFYPKLTYGFSGGFSYKDLSFSFLLQGVGGIKSFFAYKSLGLSDSYGNFNRWNKILDAYPKTNDIPRLTVLDLNHNFTTDSDWFLEDASYLRVKNINLTYSLNRYLYKISPALRDGGSALSVYTSIDNLYTFTKYSGMDPEVGGKGLDGGKYPVPRVISFGVKLTY
ncbi:TonB-dependent receptor SusC [termite gut metagenome]|uniref:TonB-dependent receptor SusC n=1 Tax=termite gut metagenome TaxID=433724 RepID=A0A5J4SJH9_9ZZZZ